MVGPGKSILLTFTAALSAVAAAAPAPPEGLPALAQLTPGRWQIQRLDTAEPGRTICLGDPLALLQLEHRGRGCARDMVTSDATGGTLHYTCKGRGFGHSKLRIETPRLVRIETQGIANNRPFAYRAEARRVGIC